MTTSLEQIFSIHNIIFMVKHLETILNIRESNYKSSTHINFQKTYTKSNHIRD